MIINYKLSTGSKRGSRDDPNLNINFQTDSVELFFYLSNATKLTDNYYVTIIDSLDQKIRLQVKDSKVTLPQKLVRPQTLKVFVDLEECGKIIKSWVCRTLPLENIENMQKSSLGVGVDVVGLSEQVSEIETDIDTLKEKIATLESQSIDAFKTSILEQLTTILTAHNSLAEDIAKIKSELSL